MQEQWANIAFPGQCVQVKIKDKVKAAVVEKCHFISILSYMTVCFCNVAEANLRLADSDQLLSE